MLFISVFPNSASPITDSYRSWSCKVVCFQSQQEWWRRFNVFVMMCRSRKSPGAACLCVLLVFSCWDICFSCKNVQFALCSACLDWAVPVFQGALSIKSHSSGWHLKAEPSQLGCRGQRSWFIGCCPLALICTLSTKFTGFLKVSVAVRVGTAHPRAAAHPLQLSGRYTFVVKIETSAINVLIWPFLIVRLAFQSMKQDCKENFSWKRAFLRVSKGYVYSGFT